MPLSKIALLASAAAMLAGNAGELGAKSTFSTKDVIEANTRARGGAAALDSVKSIRVDSKIIEPGFEAVGRYYARADGKMRIDVFKECKRVFSEGLDDEGAWEWPASLESARVAPEGGAKALRHGIEFNLFGLNRYAGRGNKIDLIGREMVKGSSLYVLKVTLNDGFVTYRLVDPKSWMIVRSRDFRAYHPGIDPKQKWIETEYFDFRKVGRVKEAFQTRTWDMTKDAVIGTGQTLQVVHNPDILPDLFSRKTQAPPLCPATAKPGQES